MSVLKSLLTGALFVISNTQYVMDTELGCNGNAFWNFGNSTKTVIKLDNNTLDSNKELCRNMCSKDNNCHAWGIYNNNNNECNLFRLNDNDKCSYTCNKNDDRIFNGEIKKCLKNDNLKLVTIIGNIDGKIMNKFIYSKECKCFNKSSISSESKESRRLILSKLFGLKKKKKLSKFNKFKKSSSSDKFKRPSKFGGIKSKFSSSSDKFKGKNGKFSKLGGIKKKIFNKLSSKFSSSSSSDKFKGINGKFSSSSDKFNGKISKLGGIKSKLLSKKFSSSSSDKFKGKGSKLSKLIGIKKKIFNKITSKFSSSSSSSDNFKRGQSKFNRPNNNNIYNSKWNAINVNDIINEVENDLTQNNNNNNNNSLNIIIGISILICIFIFGIFIGKCMNNNKRINKHKYSVVNSKSSESEYTTDDNKIY